MVKNGPALIRVQAEQITSQIAMPALVYCVTQLDEFIVSIAPSTESLQVGEAFKDEIIFCCCDRFVGLRNSKTQDQIENRESL